MQDYARHLVNSYIVSDKSSEALATGMMTVASNATLRGTLATAARDMVVKWYDPQRIELHGAQMYR